MARGRRTDAMAPGPNGSPVHGTGPAVGAPAFAPVNPRDDDPAFQNPSDPLKSRSDQKQAIERARVIYREVPNVVVQTGWTPDDIRKALVDLVVGLFDRPAQLLDAISADSRVQSAMRSRSGGLLGRPVRFKLPEKYADSPRAKKCLRAWERHWPQMHAEPGLLDLLETSHVLGFSYSQIAWDTSSPIWKPYLRSFNPRYSYYFWPTRQHIAVTLDGQVPIVPGDGHWVLHAPYGSYRGWMRGALRALAQWWLARNYALRDWARYSERHGFPILLADTPFGADPDDIVAYRQALATLGQESILQTPAGPDAQKYGKYDLRYLEARDRAWQGFQELISQCNDEITLALLGQNLTSQVKEGSFAAARVHADVRQAILEADARALAKTFYNQVLRPFAAFNFDDPDIAPVVSWDVRPQEDLEQKAKTFGSFAQALQYLRTAGFALKDPETFARKFGLTGLELREVPPVQIEAQLARATGKISDASGGDSLKKVAPVKGEESEDDESASKNDSDKDEQAHGGARITAVDAGRTLSGPLFHATDRVRLTAHAIDAKRGGVDGYYVWHTDQDSNVCDECEDLDGEQFESLDDFPDTHPNCRCVTEFVRVAGRTAKQKASARRRSRAKAVARRKAKAEEQRKAKQRAKKRKAEAAKKKAQRKVTKAAA